jgi:hypothetical protein
MTMATPDILTNICTTCFDNKKFSLSNFYSVLYLFFRFQLLPDSGNGKPLVCGERMSEQRRYSPYHLVIWYGTVFYSYQSLICGTQMYFTNRI